MIALKSLAFDFLRQHKNVEASVEELVLRKSKGRVTESELLTIFENGISGQYGKIYSLDAATLMNWIDAYKSKKNNAKNYLSSGLLPVNFKDDADWFKEANKCFVSFQNGVSPQYFNPFVYDRMMLDGKIPYNAYLKHYSGDEIDNSRITEAKQKILEEVFTIYKNQGWNQVYFIKAE